VCKCVEDWAKAVDSAYKEWSRKSLQKHMETGQKIISVDPWPEVPVVVGSTCQQPCEIVAKSSDLRPLQREELLLAHAHRQKLCGRGHS